MRGDDRHQEGTFRYISPDARVPQDHPLRVIRDLVDEVLQQSWPTFARLCSQIGRPSIPPRMLLRALLLQVLYTVRSERQLMEQLDYNLLFRRFVGLNMDEPVWDPTTFTKNRQLLLDGDIAQAFSPACWRKPTNATCCRPSISRSTARSSKPGWGSKASGPRRRTEPSFQDYDRLLTTVSCQHLCQRTGHSLPLRRDPSGRRGGDVDRAGDGGVVGLSVTPSGAPARHSFWVTSSRGSR